MFIINQRYTDPITLKVKSLQISLTLDARRTEYDTDMAIKPILIATATSGGEDDAFLSPEEYLLNIVDSKRTDFAAGCIWSYLTKPYKSYTNELVLNGLECDIGDPIAIMSDLDGTIVNYAIVTDIKDNIIKINSPLRDNFYKGAIVQNLANRWMGYSLKKDMIGIKSKLLRPISMDFSVKSENGIIKFMLHPCPNKGSIICYDVYIRNKSFNIVELHWVPDAKDVSLDKMYLDIKTYNGGENAGGGMLENKEYFVGLVSKDKIGRVNVNESLPTIKTIQN